MHNLYEPSVIIYSQHSDISIKAGVALHLAHFSLFNFFRYLFIRSANPGFLYNFFTKQNKNKNISTIIYNNLLSFRSLVVAAVTTAGVRRVNSLDWQTQPIY
jgi:hypothetical protein